MYISISSTIKENLNNYASRFPELKMNKINLLLAVVSLMSKGEDIRKIKSLSEELLNSLENSYR